MKIQLVIMRRKTNHLIYHPIPIQFLILSIELLEENSQIKNAKEISEKLEPYTNRTMSLPIVQDGKPAGNPGHETVIGSEVIHEEPEENTAGSVRN